MFHAVNEITRPMCLPSSFIFIHARCYLGVKDYEIHFFILFSSFSIFLEQVLNLWIFLLCKHTFPLCLWKTNMKAFIE